MVFMGKNPLRTRQELISELILLGANTQESCDVSAELTEGMMEVQKKLKHCSSSELRLYEFPREKKRRVETVVRIRGTNAC